MGFSEDYIYDIFNELEKKSLKDSFHKQLNKMRWQDKHRYKTPKEKYEYAYNKVLKELK
jgi:hypothetical protein